MKRSWCYLPLLLAALVMIFTCQVFAKAEADTKGSLQRTSLQGFQDTANRTLVNIGQVAMWIYSDGASAITPGGCSGLIFPRGNSPATAAIFTDGLVWGGLVNDGAEPRLRVGGGTYSIGTVPGAIISQGVREDLNDRINVDRVWRIRRDYPTADLQQDAAEVNQVSAATVSDAQVAAIRALYKRDWIDWPTHKGAPYYDAEGDGQYNPGFRTNSDGIEVPKLAPRGEEEFDPAIHADEPGVADGDQVVWLVNNDLDPGAVQTLYGSPSIGFEQQITLWAYARTDALGLIIFKQFRIIWKGTTTTPVSATIDSLHFCQWSDPDLGTFTDDFAGSDTLLSLGYAYNSSSNDATYASVGLPPPASGYDFFAGPLVDDPDGEAIFGLERISGRRNLPMTTFGFFAAGGTDSDPTRGGDYNGTLQWWNLLRGFRPRPEFPATPWRDPTQGDAITKFVLTGDPVAGTGWIDSNPGDRRILLASGPFTMALGDTNETVVAVLAALGSDRLSSVAVLKFTDRFAQEAFDNLFELPKPPISPVLSATEFDGKILLNWGEDPTGVSRTEGLDDKGFLFEGYNVYQLPTSGASISQGIRLATFDAVNEATVIAQEAFDPSSGLVLQLPVQFGTNSGIQRTLVLDTDRIRELPLINGQTYFFGVTAYSFNSDVNATLKTLESTPSLVTVVPQTTKPGIRLTAEVGEIIAIAHEGPSDGSVSPTVLDPLKLTGDDYRVDFAVDTLGATLWTLTNTSTGEILLANQVNQSGDADYLITEGMQVIVAGPPPGVKPGNMFDNADNPELWGWDIPAGTRRFTWSGSDFGFQEGAFFGAIGWASPYRIFVTGDPQPSPILPAENKPVRLILAMVDIDGNFDVNDPNVSSGYRYLRGASAPPARPEFAPFIIDPTSTYQFQVFERNVPLAAFDMSDPSNPRRLVVGFLENNVEGGTVDGIWWPPNFQDIGNVTSAGPREWLFIFDVDYSETQDAAYSDNVIFNDYPVMYWTTLGRRGNVPFSPGGTGEDQFDIFPNIPNSPLDTFTFTSSAPSSNTETARQDLLNLMNVFPNPYLGVNSFELNRFQRFVTFSHLPERATIRIFNLSGVLVVTLAKDDASQFVQWNLQNENGLPVASGIYIANVEAPDQGLSKNLKLVVVQEQQFLRAF